MDHFRVCLSNFVQSWLIFLRSHNNFMIMKRSDLYGPASTPVCDFHRCLFRSFSIYYFKIQTNEVKLFRSHRTNYIYNLLKSPFHKAYSLNQENEESITHNNDKIKEKVYLLSKEGIEKNTIAENMWILTFDKDELTSRLKLLKRWNFTNPNYGISILKLSFSQLFKYTLKTEHEFKYLDGKNRITYLATFIKSEERKICDIFLKYTFMMTIRVESLKEILKMLRGQGVLPEDILSDIWLFRYSPKLIANRIKLLDQMGARERCKTIKPWMLRCSEAILNRYFELRDENIAALGPYSNLRELLSNELGLSLDDVDEMFLKHPPLEKISYSKAKEMIDFLKAEGFSSRMIYNVPRVLCHKQATLVDRMMELKKINPQLINLPNICRNKKDFVALLNKKSITYS